MAMMDFAYANANELAPGLDVADEPEEGRVAVPDAYPVPEGGRLDVLVDLGHELARTGLDALADCFRLGHLDAERCDGERE